MSFEHIEYIFGVILFMILFTYLTIRTNKQFFSWVADHWFMKRSKSSKVASILSLIGICMLTLALMDLRGPEKNITGKISDQRTIILVDSSASMLAEDVRPNRYKKALLLVKHYVKKAVGQQISIVVFSDGQKRIVPFTNDFDLIEARIHTLEELELERGGTGLTLAIQESIQYFKNNSGTTMGNILIFTDAEETEEAFDLEIPDGITIGLVGVGTAKGAPIPIRNRRGVSKGNKKYNGKVVITKLDENFMKKLSKKIKNFKYWIVTSYSLPTAEIHSFFKSMHKVKTSKNSFRIKPVLANYLLVPALVILCLSYILLQFRSFVPMCLLLFLLTGHAQENSGEQEKKEPERSEKTLGLQNKILNGTITRSEKSALAEGLYKDGFPKDAQNYYEEFLKEDMSEETKVDYFNYASSLLKNGKVKKAAQIYKNLLAKSEDKKIKLPEKFTKAIKENLIKALSNKSGKGGKSDKKEKGDSKSKDDKKSDNSGEGKEKKDQKNKEEKKKDKKGKGKKKKDKDDSGKKNKQKKKDEKKSGKPNKFNKKKLPSLLKQLISDDNQLQKKMIDAKTTQRKTRERKDW